MRGWFGAGTLGHAGENSAGRWPARLVPKLERLEVDSRRLGTHRMALQKKQVAYTSDEVPKIPAGGRLVRSRLIVAERDQQGPPQVWDARQRGWAQV